MRSAFKLLLVSFGIAIVTSFSVKAQVVTVEDYARAEGFLRNYTAPLVFKDAKSRIIEFLIDEAELKGQKVGFETLVKNMLTHQDISRLTATSRQTVTTVLNELREANIINFDRKRFLVRDLSELKKMIK